MGAGDSGRSLYRLVTRHRGRERVHAAPPTTSYRRALGLVQDVVRRQHAAGDPPQHVLLQRRFPRQNGHTPRRSGTPTALEGRTSPAAEAPTPSAADSGVWITVESWDERVIARILVQQPAAAGATATTAAPTPEHGQPPRMASHASDGATDRSQSSGSGTTIGPRDASAPTPAAAAAATPTGGRAAATWQQTAAYLLPRPAVRHRRSRWSLVTTVLVLILAWVTLAALLAGWPGGGGRLHRAASRATATQPTLPFEGPLLDLAP